MYELHVINRKYVSLREDEVVLYVDSQLSQPWERCEANFGLTISAKTARVEVKVLVCPILYLSVAVENNKRSIASRRHAVVINPTRKRTTMWMQEMFHLVDTTPALII